MTNFIFKSQGTYKKLANQLEVVLNEQRHQRHDLAAILYILKSLQNNSKLQTQVDAYYSRDGEILGTSEVSSEINPD